MCECNPFIPPPERATLVITGRCNLSCGYCYYADEMQQRNDLPTDAWKQFMVELADLGVMHVTLTGGEVFLHPDLFDIIDSVIKNRMRYGLITNATLITPEKLQNFKDGKRQQRLDFIQVSIDGDIAEIHNLSRPNSFDRAVRGLRWIKDAGLPVTARLTLNTKNVDRLEQTVTFLLDDVGLDDISTGEVLAVGSACRPGVTMALTAADKKMAAGIFAALAEKYPGRIRAAAGPQVAHTMYDQMEQARSGGALARDWKMGCLSACGCVFSQMDVLHDGSIIPCTMMSGPVLGKINQDSLRLIWERHPVLQQMRSRDQVRMAAIAECRGCEWNAYCNGGCPGGVYQHQQNFLLPDPQFCYRNYLKELSSV